tara:strand:- start:163 stop:387 length:225 start_codon:yes stop_codon:yes gene_type:complete
LHTWGAVTGIGKYCHHQEKQHQAQKTLDNENAATVDFCFDNVNVDIVWFWISIPHPSAPLPCFYELSAFAGGAA